ncbi:unnamed protein product [Amoebophrya sp. A25]|nr:unnamed protein product [Amoebophrya sp. A25]|eukprot:GSA25T00017206001.1
MGKRGRWGTNKKADAGAADDKDNAALPVDASAAVEILDDRIHSSCILLLLFHHLLNEDKRAALVQWSRELGLHGWSKAGHPGVVLVGGAEYKACYELVKRLRELRWQTMEVRLEIRGTREWFTKLIAAGAPGGSSGRISEQSGGGGELDASDEQRIRSRFLARGAGSSGNAASRGRAGFTFLDYAILSAPGLDEEDDGDVEDFVHLRGEGPSPSKKRTISSNRIEKYEEKAQELIARWRSCRDAYDEYLLLNALWPNASGQIDLTGQMRGRDDGVAVNGVRDGAGGFQHKAAPRTSTFLEVTRSNSTVPFEVLCPRQIWIWSGLDKSTKNPLPELLQRQSPDKYLTWPERTQYVFEDGSTDTVFVGVSEHLFRGMTPAEKRSLTGGASGYDHQDGESSMGMR